MSERLNFYVELPYDDFDPGISSENVNTAVLESILRINSTVPQANEIAIENAKTPKNNRAVYLLDYSINTGDVDRFMEADELLAEIMASGNLKESITAAKYHCYAPLFLARVQRRQYTIDELQESKERLEQSINYYAEANKKLGDFYYEKYQEEQGELERNFEDVPSGVSPYYTSATASELLGATTNVKGISGELLAMWLSVYNACNNQGDVLYPSMLREESPMDYKHARYFFGLTHDLHTYDVSNPNARKLFSVKTVNKMSAAKGSHNPKLNLLFMAAKAMRAVNPNKSKSSSTGIYTIFNHWRKAQRQNDEPSYRDDELNWHTPSQQFSWDFIDRLAGMVQDIVDAAPEESTMY